MTTAAVTTRADRPLRIGAVCGRLREEFPDVSISKIRYLEDQGLLNPGRTQGGYRLYRDEDVERLRTILRMQRDEFLPLRVIREELAAAGRGRREGKKRAAPTGLKAHLDAPLIELDDLCDRSGAEPALVAELQQYRILKATPDGRFHETDVEIVEACSRLLRYGIEPRNLGKFRSAADNEADLLTKAVAADLYARTPERRERGREDLEKLAAAAIQLSQLLFYQAVRSEVSSQ
jgi:DNA-binding transcriptional MerR regulator